MRDVLRSSRASVTTSRAVVVREVGRGRDLKSRSASAMRALIAVDENWRAAGGVVSGDSARRGDDNVGSGGASSARAAATERGLVADDAEVCDCAGTRLVTKREAETAITAKIFFILRATTVKYSTSGRRLT